MIKNFCRNMQGLAQTMDVQGVLAVVRLRCKQWDCEYCAEKNRKQWLAHLAKTLPQVSNSWAFITLTAHSHSHASGKTLEACQRGVDLLLKRMRHLSEISYVRVYENHKSGAIHAHLIVSGMPERVSWEISKKTPKNANKPIRRWYIKHDAPHTWSLKSWLKKSALEVGLGYMVDVQFIRRDTYMATNYILKYMYKDAQTGFDKKGLRRIAVSRDIGSPHYESEYTWSLLEHLTEKDIVFAAQNGLSVVDLTAKHTVTRADFRDSDVYPPAVTE